MNLQKATLTKRTPLTDDITQFHFETGHFFDFIPGQFITIKICDEKETVCFRAYSIASSPDEHEKGFDLCIKFIEGGRASTWFKKLNVDYEIEFLGPNGNFTLNKKSNKNALFIATGTGIAPLKSMLEYYLKKQNNKKMHLIFGIRYIKDIFYQDIFEKLSKKHKNFTYEIILSRPENDSWKGPKGHVQDLIKEMKIEPKNTETYVCGLKDMVEEVITIFEKKGLTKNSIYSEKY